MAKRDLPGAVRGAVGNRQRGVDLGEATAGDARALRADDVSRNTVSTMVTRLEEKGLAAATGQAIRN